MRVVVIAVAVVALACTGPATHSGAPTTTTAPRSSPSSVTQVTTTTSAPEPATSELASRCRDDEVAVTSGAGGAGLGHEDLILLFTNTTDRSCALSGYPGVAALDDGGNQVSQAARSPSGYLGGLRPGTTDIPVVVLHAGDTASAIVEGTATPISPASSCPSYPALLVIPPDLTASTRLVISNDIGGRFPGCTQLQVHPVVPGSTGRVE